MTKNWKAPKDHTFEKAIIREIDTRVGQGCHYEKSVLGGSIRWSPVIGKFIPVTQVKRQWATAPMGKKRWWSIFGQQAREHARQHHLPGPNFQDVAPAITPNLVKVVTWEVDDSAEREIRELIVQETLDELLAEGRIIKHPTLNLYKKVW